MFPSVRGGGAAWSTLATLRSCGPQNRLGMSSLASYDADLFFHSFLDGYVVTHFIPRFQYYRICMNPFAVAFRLTLTSCQAGTLGLIVCHWGWAYSPL